MKTKMFEAWSHWLGWHLHHTGPLVSCDEAIGLYIIYFKWYDTYHDTHEVMFDMYQW